MTDPHNKAWTEARRWIVLHLCLMAIGIGIGALVWWALEPVVRW